jgi:hypothetical protein
MPELTLKEVIDALRPFARKDPEKMYSAEGMDIEREDIVRAREIVSRFDANK